MQRIDIEFAENGWVVRLLKEGSATLVFENSQDLMAFVESQLLAPPEKPQEEADEVDVTDYIKSNVQIAADISVLDDRLRGLTARVYALENHQVTATPITPHDGVK